MDGDYARIGGADGSDAYTDFQPALSVVTTVVSVHGDDAIVDGGYKSFCDRSAVHADGDRPARPRPIGWAGDEHGRLDLRGAPARLQVGDRVAFQPPHCDPTVNLYDEIHVLRGDSVEAVWPIAARGKSQ